MRLLRTIARHFSDATGLTDLLCSVFHKPHHQILAQTSYGGQYAVYCRKCGTCHIVER